MAGGKGGAKKLRRSTGSVAAGEARKVSSSKSKSRGKPAPAVGTALVKAASAPPPTLAVPETLDMAIDDETSASITKQIRKAGKSGGASSSAAGAVVYLGHIPHGFYEEQMKGFFSQFGLVNRIHLARNRKTGASKHYAFIEFAHKEVAAIVAKAMHGYLMFSKILVCQVVPPDEVHPNTFKHSSKPYRHINWVTRERQRHNTKRSPEAEEAHEQKLLKGEKRKRNKLAEAGIDYDFPGYEAALAQRTAKRATKAKAA